MTPSSSAEDLPDITWTAGALQPIAGAPSNTGTGGLPPLPSSRLFGRTGELAFIFSVVQQRSTQLLTILGPGGVGKTRLALTAAWELASSFEDGVAFIRFVETDPENVWEVIALKLGAPAVPGQLWQIAVQHCLQSRHMLIILDECEHLTEALADLGQILATCPDVFVIATSQETLGATDEQEFWLQPLALPRHTLDISADSIARSSAVEVFVSRAHRRDPAFELGDDNAADIAAIVRMLDGLPLAIELAAAQTRHLSPADLRQRLESALPLLSGGSRDLPEHQRSLLGMTEWSLSLLSSEDRDRFLQLSVIDGDFTPEMGAIIAGLTPGDGWELLISFADKSLVKRVVASEHKTTRFFILQTVHAVALHLLKLHPEHYLLASTRHASACLAIAREAEANWHTADHIEWLQRMDQEHANIKTVIERALNESNLVPAALELSGHMFWYWFSRGYHLWALPRIEQLLRSSPDGVPPDVRGAAHITAGWFAFKQAQLNRADHHFREGVRLIPNAAASAALRGLIGLSYTISFRGEEATQASGLLRDVVRHAKSNPDAWHELVAAHFGIGLTGYFAGDVTLAQTGFEESLQIARSRGDRQSIALNLLYLAQIDRVEGDPAAAIRKLQDLVPLLLNIGDQNTIALSLDVAISTLVDLNQIALANRMTTVVEQIRTIQGMPRSPLEQADFDDASQRMRKTIEAHNHMSVEASPKPLLLDEIVDDFLRYQPLSDAQPGSEHGHPTDALTPRELEVLRLIANGKTSAEIAEVLFLSQHTIKRHMANIRRKLGVRTQAAAVAALQRIL